MKKLKEFKAAIFDMDGTLLNSMEIWDTLVDNFIKSKGFVPSMGLRQEILALNMYDTAKLLQDRYGFEGTPYTIMDDINGFAYDEYNSKAEANPGVLEYLKILRSKGIRTAVVTATDRVIAEPTLRRTGILEYVDKLYTCTEENTSKNEPDIYINAAKALGLSDLYDCAVFEDALHCIITSKNAGFYTVGVYEEVFRGNFEKIKEISDEYIYSFEEILDG